MAKCGRRLRTPCVRRRHAIGVPFFLCFDFLCSDQSCRVQLIDVRIAEQAEPVHILQDDAAVGAAAVDAQPDVALAARIVPGRNRGIRCRFLVFCHPGQIKLVILGRESLLVIPAVAFLRAAGIALLNILLRAVRRNIAERIRAGLAGFKRKRERRAVAQREFDLLPDQNAQIDISILIMAAVAVRKIVNKIREPLREIRGAVLDQADDRRDKVDQNNDCRDDRARLAVALNAAGFFRHGGRNSLRADGTRFVRMRFVLCGRAHAFILWVYRRLDAFAFGLFFGSDIP